VFTQIETVDEPDQPPTVRVSGEVDLASAPELREAIAKLAADRPPLVVVDLTDVPFLDSSGLGAIAGGLKLQRPHGGRLEVRGARPTLRRIFEVAGLALLLGD
jgi:anti-sigma B factor antagonist